jgi:hypothetical protein
VVYPAYPPQPPKSYGPFDKRRAAIPQTQLPFNLPQPLPRDTDRRT